MLCSIRVDFFEFVVLDSYFFISTFGLSLAIRIVVDLALLVVGADDIGSSK